MPEDQQQRGFSITNLLTQPNTDDQSNEEENHVEKEDNSSTRTSSSVSPLSATEPMVPEELAGMLNFSPVFMQQMAQNAAAAFALNNQNQQQQKTKVPNSTPIIQANPSAVNKRLINQEVPTTSALMPPPNAPPEWYNAMNYLNMASRQLQFMTNAAHPGLFY